MRLPRLNRRQKIVRNFLLIFLTLLLLEWSSGFPAWTLDGLLRRDAVRLFDEEFGVFGGIDLAAGKRDGYYPIRLFAFDNLADAASAEMDITVSYTSNQIVSTCTVEGERAAENCWRFDVSRQYDAGDTGELAQWEREIFSGSQKDRYSGTLRLYDSDGALLRSWDFDRFQQSTMRWK